MNVYPCISLLLLKGVCQFFRQVKIILLWEESILSFWISALFLGAGIISLLLPWGFILTWTGRIVVYGFFGPHMKIVDLYLRANKSDELQQIMDAFDAKKQIARIRREQALKVKAVKCLRFGKLITQVPAFNLARHYDRPLPSSTAKIMRKAPAIEYTSVLPGQQLYGDMIPRLEDMYQSNAALALGRMEKLSQVETRLIIMQAAAKLRGGLRRHRHLRLKKESAPDEMAPFEAGYELVRIAGESHSQLVVPTETQLTNMTSTSPNSRPLARDGRRTSAARFSQNMTPSSEDANHFEQASIKLRTNASFFMKSCECENEEDDDEFSVLSPTSISERLSDETVASIDESEVGGAEGNSVWEFQGEDIVLEEGIEIVAWGRVHHCHEGARVDHTLLPRGGLSVLYRESDSTFVAFYRE